MEADISCIIVTHNNAGEVVKCLESVLTSSFKPEKIIVVDNASDDGTRDRFVAFKGQIEFINSRINLGYAKACNEAFKLVTTKYVCFLNPDTVLSNTAFGSLVEFMEKNLYCGACGPQFVNEKGNLKNSVAKLPTLTDQFVPKSFLKLLNPERYYKKSEFTSATSVESLVGACLLVRCGIFRKLGGFNEQYFVFFEETELCKWIVGLGQSVFIVPYVKIIHLGGKSKSFHSIDSKIEYYKSLFAFFKRNRPSKEYITLLSLLPLKFLIELLFFSAINICTLLMIQKFRVKLNESFLLLRWSLVFYPKKWGIKR
ncbi:MAG: glycosyltransferase family 2 protein [Planctomycetes bacterium]|nr:glycosyltransferase family 2 protein [Planctomycetota bacterium]